VRELLAQAEASRGDWFDHHSGAEFLADAAVLLEEAGDPETADAYLRRASEREQEAPRYVGLARGALAARRGDPEHAETILAGVAARPDLELRERWRVSLLRAWAARRARDDARAGALAREAFEAAAATGHPELPLVREPLLGAELAALAAASGSGAAAALSPAGLPVEVSVLGGLAVRSGGVPLDPPPGRPTLLVALLAVRGGRAPADELIETLWPGVDPDSGRKRLRNVLNRLRGALGAVVVREGDVLAFAEGARVDAVTFEHEALAALDPDAGAGRARAALARYTGPLLPEAPYLDWAAEARERLSRRYLALLDLLAGEAERQDDVDEAIRLLEQAIEADRFDESRYLRAARLLLAQNRRGRALAVLRAAASALRELDLQPSDEHRELVRSAHA
jgi:DNA-binding SARP family transcriptional activator